MHEKWCIAQGQCQKTTIWFHSCHLHITQYFLPLCCHSPAVFFFVLYVTNDDGTDDDGGDRNCIDEENYLGNLFIAFNLCDSCGSDGQDTLTDE